MIAFVLAAQFGSLTLGDIIADIPRDAGAVIVFLLFAILIGVVWYGSRAEVVERYGSGEWTEADEPSAARKRNA